MNTMVKWNAIVDEFNSHKESKDEEVKVLWENVFSQIFFYSKLLGFLDSKKDSQCNSYDSGKPDILLKNSKKVPVCAVELKHSATGLDDKIQEQLFDYLKTMGINTGIIIADQFYLFTCDNRRRDEKSLFVAIPFEKDNQDGELLIKLLSQDSFEEKTIKSFIISKINRVKNVAEIKDSLTEENVKKALTEYYLNKKYTEEEIYEALKSVDIIIGENLKHDNPPKLELGNLDVEKLLKGGNPVSVYLREKMITARIIDDSYKFTVAKLNKDGIQFWANPSIEFLKYDWCLVLNDNVRRELVLYKIPANSISFDRVKIRFLNNRMLIDLHMIRNNEKCVCKVSGISFDKWYFQTIKY